VTTVGNGWDEVVQLEGVCCGLPPDGVVVVEGVVSKRTTRRRRRSKFLRKVNMFKAIYLASMYSKRVCVVLCRIQPVDVHLLIISISSQSSSYSCSSYSCSVMKCDPNAKSNAVPHSYSHSSLLISPTPLPPTAPHPSKPPAYP
jgi:hypothetical protein